MTDHARAPDDYELIHYVLDLEALVRWLARPYGYDEDDGAGGMRHVVNEPVWSFTTGPLGGNQELEANQRLAKTWKRVMG